MRSIDETMNLCMHRLQTLECLVWPSPDIYTSFLDPIGSLVSTLLECWFFVTLFQIV